MSSDADVVRRPKSSSSKARRKGSDDDGGTGKSSRSRRKKQFAKLKRSLAPAFFAAFFFVSLICVIIFRPFKRRKTGIDSERYARAKALRESVLKKEKRNDKVLESVAHSPKVRKGKKDNPLRPKQINGMRYLDPRQLPPLPGDPKEPYESHGRGKFRGIGDDEWQNDAEFDDPRGPLVDYTKHKYKYPELMMTPPNDGTYPPLDKMSTIFETWGQDDLDAPPETIEEVLQHFDYQDAEQMRAAVRYRDLELPFKVYNVPEIAAANLKWTDEYVASHFNGENDDDAPESRGMCQKSVDHFFAFHIPQKWDVDLLGPPPAVDLPDWTFDKWAQHAVYADEVSLPKTKTHYYWQSGVPREERLSKRSHWTFVSRDLPSFSSPNPTFFGFNPPEQKGIQCRFGERGVTAATHYDGGRNMIAMITGAKRYILSPPNACSQLGVVTSHKHPSYRHSMLNFGRVTLLNDEENSDVEMSEREKEWLRISANAPTLSTVLKAGEVLYCPSHWFHYIVSLQKSAQCNTRSGIHEEGNRNFGGLQDVLDCLGDGDDGA